ncbi:hypothetical protein T07_12139 [Trichinella nelsoni]|uniref:Uncharacterized protein n=1 Tax=Trichinella nelsoni TaxID=6336 RepID=A0A0V0SEH9_9BILA|nr:hypothetical protein T07_12139 [Trichinella nelsoni]
MIRSDAQGVSCCLLHEAAMILTALLSYLYMMSADVSHQGAVLRNSPLLTEQETGYDRFHQ